MLQFLSLNKNKELYLCAKKNELQSGVNEELVNRNDLMCQISVGGYGTPASIKDGELVTR
jgi:hypothetical protein